MKIREKQIIAGSLKEPSKTSSHEIKRDSKVSSNRDNRQMMMRKMKTS
jgi:hypothetical protein